MKQRIEALNKKIHETLGKRSEWISEKERIMKENALFLKEIRWGKAALNIAITVGESLQAQISSRLSSIASYALDAIWSDPYRVKLKFTSSGRGNIEAQILFCRDGEEFRPILPSGQLLAGGGPVEAAAFGLRCALWAQMSATNSRPILFMDEPFRFIQKDLQSVVAEMLQGLTKKIGLQMILITHEPEVSASADNIINIGEKQNGRTDHHAGHPSSPSRSAKKSPLHGKRSSKTTRNSEGNAGKFEDAEYDVKRTK